MNGSDAWPGTMDYVGEAEFGWLEQFESPIGVFRGVGEVRLEGLAAKRCAFLCMHVRDGRVLAECHLAGGDSELASMMVGGRPRPGLAVRGRTIDDLEMEAEGGVLVNVEVPFGGSGVSKLVAWCDQITLRAPIATHRDPAYVAYSLCNLEFLGEEWSSYTEDGGRRGALDTIRFQVEGREIAVKRVAGYDGVVRRMKATRSAAVTSEARMGLTDGGVSLDDTDRVVGAVCRLLSLAQGVEIVHVSRKVMDGDGDLVSMNTVSRLLEPGAPSGPLISGDTPGKLREFVEQCYARYLEAEGRFNLPLAMDYYLASKSSHSAQVKYLLCCIAMETLVSNFGETCVPGDVRWIVPEEEFGESQALLRECVGDCLRRVFPAVSDRQVEDAVLKIRELNRRSFRRQLKSMLSDLGVTERGLSFIEDRHKLVHEGTLGGGFRENWGRYSNLVELLDRLFLRVLGYEGEYLRYSDQVRVS